MILALGARGRGFDSHNSPFWPTETSLDIAGQDIRTGTFPKWLYRNNMDTCVSAGETLCNGLRAAMHVLTNLPANDY